jgi:DinB family protein
MLPLVRTTLSRQYGAALKMLAGCVKGCSTDHWQQAVGNFPFWHVAYHVLFYTDLYLSKNDGAFRPQGFHRPDYQVMGSQAWPPYKKVVADQPYDRPTIAGYVRDCMTKAAETVAAETEASLAGESGFAWLPFTRLELHLYNIRHIQHHTGQLAAFLRRAGCKGVGWVGSHEI